MDQTNNRKNRRKTRGSRGGKGRNTKAEVSQQSVDPAAQKSRIRTAVSDAHRNHMATNKSSDPTRRPVSTLDRAKQLRSMAEPLSNFVDGAEAKRDAAHKATPVNNSNVKKIGSFTDSRGITRDAVISTGASGSRRRTAAYDGMASHLEAIAGEDADSFTSVDDLDVLAVQILDLLLMAGPDRQYHFSNLTSHERCCLYRYFYKSNPIIRRMIRLHTEIPLSKLRIQAPEGCSEILADYIVNYYNKILRRTDFAQALDGLVRDYQLYGLGVPLIDDYYIGNNILSTVVESIRSTEISLSEEAMENTTDIEQRYKADPKSVGVAERRKYLEARFPRHFVPSYQGPDKISIIPFWDMQSLEMNRDIEYYVLTRELSDTTKGLIDALTNISKEEGEDVVDLLITAGYGRGMAETLVQAHSQNADTYCVDSDPFDNEGPFISPFIADDNTSMVEPLIDLCLEYEAARRSRATATKNIGRRGRVVSAPDLNAENLDSFRSEVETMVEDPEYSIVVNFAVTWDEKDAFVQDELRDLGTTLDSIGEEIAVGGGMPMSLISGDTQFSGGSISLEVLNTAFFNFKQRAQRYIEESIFKPIAIRKGLITFDEWGDTVVLYPSVRFSRMSIREDSTYDLLLNLYLKNSLPASVIYDLLNLEPSEIERGVRAQLFTPLDPMFNDLVSSVYGMSGDGVAELESVRKRITNNFETSEEAPREEKVDPLEASLYEEVPQSSPSNPLFDGDPLRGEDEEVPSSENGLTGDDPVTPEVELHAPTTQLPDRFDLRDPRTVDDPDLDLETPLQQE